jgi:Apea-like HEPN
MDLVYQILVLDPSEKTRCENAASLLYLIRGYTKLWKTPRVSEVECRITDGRSTLSVVAIEEAGSTATTSDELGRAFILTLSGPYDEIENRREPLAAFLKGQEFELIYVLKDQVSEQIACKLYPHLYRIENLLRGYLIRFMATHIGPRWWELTVSSEMADKAKMRKKNERIFGKYVENSAYLIDFDELGEIVYEHSSGFLTREDIVGRISGLAETPEAIREFKQELRSNYYKLFKESFADKNFKEKWKQFEAIRNKTAHNNLFTADDLFTGERLAAEITQIISGADAEASKLVITSEEREAIKEQVIARSAPWQEIKEEAFLSELDSQECLYASKRQGFVGLSRFINSYLGAKGYSFASSHAMIEHLTESGVVEVYHVTNPFDPERRTAAIRRVPAAEPESSTALG